MSVWCAGFRDQDICRIDVPVQYAAAVHIRHRSGQLDPKPNQLISGQRLRRLSQVRATNILQDDRRGIARRLHQLDHPRHPAESLQYRRLVVQSLRSVRSQRLLANDSAAGKE
jgi:hypothetical protein